MTAEENAIEPQIFLGQAGTGKTLLAKVVANELRMRAENLELPLPLFIEAFPADMPDVDALDALMRRVVANPGSVVFIDEIHDLVGAHSRKLYLVLEEQRYQFKGDATPTKLPPVTLMAATTDYGSLHTALKRRWIKHMFKPATEEQLVGYVMRRSFPITEEAAKLIVSRTKFSGAPWEALELYRMAATVAKGNGDTEVTTAHVEKIFDRQGVDELGLHWIDRMVIKALLGQPRERQFKGKPQFVCYAASESNTCTLAGVDKEEYRTAIRPKLMARKLLEAKPYYCQALTKKAVDLYMDLLDE
jgi:Holliday junction resolvasome RuvABC ATP-dependent DNA helicase subunit